MAWENFLEKLRKRPETEKTAILWAAVVFCLIIIFIIWLWSFNSTIKASLKNPIEQPSQIMGQIDEMKKDLPTLWQSLGAGISNLLNLGRQEVKYLPENQSVSPDNLPTEALPIE